MMMTCAFGSLRDVSRKLGAFGSMLVLAFAVSLPEEVPASPFAPLVAVQKAQSEPGNDTLQIHCCHAHRYPPHTAYCCHAPPAVVVVPRAYYGPTGVVGQSRRVARRTARRVTRRR
jgi:hypothetical protein